MFILPDVLVSVHCDLSLWYDPYSRKENLNKFILASPTDSHSDGPPKDHLSDKRVLSKMSQKDEYSHVPRHQGHIDSMKERT